ncbi:MAG: efflux transporter outer membrane subunit [Steroidobacterales bacterium]
MGSRCARAGAAASTAAVVALATGVMGLAALGGCAVGPRYVRPTVAVPQQFSEVRPGSFDVTHPPASALWHSFGDPILDQLIDTALAHSTTLAQSVAQLNEARALRGLEYFALLPTVTASASRQAQLFSSENPLVPPNLGKITTFNAGFDASWEINIFGGAVSASRAAIAEERAARAGLEAARQSVVAEVAQAYFSLRADQERLRVAQRNIANLTENQQLLEARLEGGRGTELDVTRGRALLLGTAARVPQTQAAITRDEQRLAVLTAEPIGALITQLGAPRPLPAMPSLVAIGTPAEWFQRRPDIRQAEQKLISQTRQISVEMANYFPQLTLVGGFGWSAQTASALGSSASRQWNYGPSLTWSFLDIGRVHQRVLAQKARAAGAIATYQDTVLRAIEDTENALAGYRAANESAMTLEEAVKASRTATELAQAQFQAGGVDTLVVLDAERSQLDLEDQLATAESQRATALAALYKALVGDFALGPAAAAAAPPT